MVYKTEPTKIKIWPNKGTVEEREYFSHQFPFVDNKVLETLVLKNAFNKHKTVSFNFL